MKKHMTVFFLFSFFIMAVPTHAVVVNLIPPDIEEAVAFGTANRSSIEKALDARYGFGSTDEYDEGGVVHTKWYKLALMSAQKAEKGAALSPQEKTQIVSDPCIQINIRVYGRSLDFARDYSVTLLQNEKIIKPEKQHADSFITGAAGNKSLKGFPGYYAVMRSYFSYAAFDPAAPVVLILKKDGRESRFPIDLKRYK
jgi:hypothetical protein